ncbi:MAG: EamA family transporter RarD [Opitutaceae bacterium]
MSSHDPASSPARGVIAAFLCYLAWGLVPLFWKELGSVDALELIAHRHVWSLVFLAGVLTWLGGWPEAVRALRTPRDLAINAASSLLLTINWLIYVWAVNRGQVIECSLGYFLVPLLNVTLGRLVLHETLRPLQGAAVAAAAIGVGLLVFRLGHVPWIALGLAGSFGFYGLLRKRSPLGPLTGLAVETALLAPLAGGWLLWKAAHGSGALGHSDARVTTLVLSTGVVTAIPLLLFAYGARRLRLTTLGLLQYTAPTCQFLLGWLVYREPFTRDRAWAFVLIWSGLACYTLDAWLTQRRTPSG